MMAAPARVATLKDQMLLGLEYLTSGECEELLLLGADPLQKAVFPGWSNEAALVAYASHEYIDNVEHRGAIFDLLKHVDIAALNDSLRNESLWDHPYGAILNGGLYLEDRIKNNIQRFRNLADALINAGVELPDLKWSRNGVFYLYQSCAGAWSASDISEVVTKIKFDTLERLYGPVRMVEYVNQDYREYGVEEGNLFAACLKARKSANESGRYQIMKFMGSLAHAGADIYQLDAQGERYLDLFMVDEDRSYLEENYLFGQAQRAALSMANTGTSGKSARMRL